MSYNLIKLNFIFAKEKESIAASTYITLNRFYNAKTIKQQVRTVEVLLAKPSLDALHI